MNHRDRGFRRVHTEYRSRAHANHLEWSLTTEKFFALLTAPCHYCGCGPQRIVWTDDPAWADEGEMFICNGVDRKDSSLGYTETNSVAACTLCNWRKGDMNYPDFRDWVRRVYQHLEQEPQ